MINKFIYFVILLVLPFPFFAQEIPRVPKAITFENMVLSIEDEAQNTIQNEVDAIHANEKYLS